MRNIVCHSLYSVVIVSGLGSAAALAHGPVIVLTKGGNNQVVTHQMDVTPQNDSASSSDYPVGAAAQSFPSGYNASNLATFDSSAFPADKPQNLQAFPLVYTTVSTDPNHNSGWYGQLEANDAEGNPTLDTGPGYAYGNGGFTSGTMFQITFGHALQYWNGSSFGNTPNGEQLQAIRGSSVTGTAYGNTLTSNGAQGGTGLQVTVSAAQNGGSHSQLMYRLMDSLGDSTDTAGIADGLYLGTFQISTASGSPTSLAASLPYYFLFEKDDPSNPAVVTATDLTAANHYIDANLVPEPVSLGMLVLGGAGLAMRGRRRR